MILENIEKMFPMRIKNMERIIQRVQEQYPTIDRSAVTMVIHSFFTMMRFELLTGKVFDISGYFPKMGLVQYRHGDAQALKVKMSSKTPRFLK